MYINNARAGEHLPPHNSGQSSDAPTSATALTQPTMHRPIISNAPEWREMKESVPHLSTPAVVVLSQDI